MRILLFMLALVPTLCFGASSTIHDLPNRATNATTSYMIWDDSVNNYNQTFGQLTLNLSTNRTFYDGLTVAGNGVADGSMKLWNAAGTFGVTFGIDAGLSADTNLFFPSILHSSVENNIFTNLTVNNITNTYSYATNQYVTFNTNNYSYVTNQYVTTNYVDNDYVTNMIVKNLRTDVAYISNTFVTNITVTGSQTNSYLEPNMFVFTDANKKLVSTLDGSLLTNLPISAQVWTNDGTYISAVDTNPAVSVRELEVGYLPRMWLTNFGFSAPTDFHPLLASSYAREMPSTYEWSIGQLFDTDINAAGYVTGYGWSDANTNVYSLFEVMSAGKVRNAYIDHETKSYFDGRTFAKLKLASGGQSSIEMSADDSNPYFKIAWNTDAFVTITTNGVASRAFQVLTNAWSGPTNSVNMTNQWQKYLAYTPCSITGLVNKSVDGKVVNNVLVTITNAASTNITFYYEGAIRTGDGARSWVITNACEGKLSLEYDPNGSTNAVFRMFY